MSNYKSLMERLEKRKPLTEKISVVYKKEEKKSEKKQDCKCEDVQPVAEAVEITEAKVSLETALSRDLNVENSIVEILKRNDLIKEREEAMKFIRMQPNGQKALDEAFGAQHYKLLADIVKDIPSDNTRRRIAARHADMFHMDNPRFKRAEFYKMAGVVDPDAVAADDAAGKTPAAHLDAH